MLCEQDTMPALWTVLRMRARACNCTWAMSTLTTATSLTKEVCTCEWIRNERGIKLKLCVDVDAHRGQRPPHLCRIRNGLYVVQGTSLPLNPHFICWLIALCQMNVTLGQNAYISCVDKEPACEGCYFPSSTLEFEHEDNSNSGKHWRCKDGEDSCCPHGLETGH